MSNTKQQIENLIGANMGLYYRSSTDQWLLENFESTSKRYIGVKDKTAEVRNTVEAIDRLVTEARRPYIEMLNLYGKPICNYVYHPKGYYHGELESCPVVKRIAELQSQLTNKEEK